MDPEGLLVKVGASHAIPQGKVKDSAWVQEDIYPWLCEFYSKSTRAKVQCVLELDLWFSFISGFIH